MIKTYLIGDHDAIRFQNNVNKFISDKKVIDIKYQAVLVGPTLCDRAMIIYEEENNND